MRNHSWSNDRELTHNFVFTNREDSVVCQVTPLVVNCYEVYSVKPSDEAYETGEHPENQLERQILQISDPQEPVYTTLSIREYNAALQNSLDAYEKDVELIDPSETPETVSPDVSLQLIDESTLPKSCTGDPTAYNHTLYGAIGVYHFGSESTSGGLVDVAVKRSDTEEMAGAELSFGHSDGTETGFNFHGQATIKFGGKKERKNAIKGLKEIEGHISFMPEGEVTHMEGSSSMDGVSFETVYYTPSAEQQILGEYTYAENESYGKINTELIHYDPEKDNWYDYNADSVVYKTDFKGGKIGIFALGFTTSMKYEQPEDNEAVETDGGYVENPTPLELNYLYPPEPPRDFAVQSMTKNDDGSLDVTLIWNSKNRKRTFVDDPFFDRFFENSSKQLI